MYTKRRHVDVCACMPSASSCKLCIVPISSNTHSLHVHTTNTHTQAEHNDDLCSWYYCYIQTIDLDLINCSFGFNSAVGAAQVTPPPLYTLTTHTHNLNAETVYFSIAITQRPSTTT